MGQEPFKGDKRLPMKSPLAKGEQALIRALLPRIPRWIEGYHLTLVTIPLCAVCIAAGYLGRERLAWLWLTSAALALQWFTDSFDGALGRHRDTGIPKWGYYMDHLLDYAFMCALLLGYAWLFDGTTRLLWLAGIPIFGVFFVSTYLAFASTHEFKIDFLGFSGTEMRILLVLLNTAILAFGRGFVERALPYAVALVFAAVCVVVFRTQRYIWRTDMRDKAARTGTSAGR